MTSGSVRDLAFHNEDGLTLETDLWTSHIYIAHTCLYTHVLASSTWNLQLEYEHRTLGPRIMKDVKMV